MLSAFLIVCLGAHYSWWLPSHILKCKLKNCLSVCMLECQSNWNDVHEASCFCSWAHVSTEVRMCNWSQRLIAVLSAGGILMKQTVKLCNYKTLPQVNTQVNELGGSHKLMHHNKLENNSSCTAFVQSLHSRKGCLAMNLACPCHLLLPL